MTTLPGTFIPTLAFLSALALPPPSVISPRTFLFLLGLTAGAEFVAAGLAVLREHRREVRMVVLHGDVLDAVPAERVAR